MALKINGRVVQEKEVHEGMNDLALSHSLPHWRRSAIVAPGFRPI
jgi:hypothetical protein